MRSLSQRHASLVFRSAVPRAHAAWDTAASRRGFAMLVKPTVISEMSKQIEEYPHMDALKMWTEDGEAHL